MEALEAMKWQTSYTYYDEGFGYMTTVGHLTSDDAALAHFSTLAEMGGPWRKVSYVTRRGSANAKITVILPWKYDAETDTVCLVQ